MAHKLIECTNCCALFNLKSLFGKIKALVDENKNMSMTPGNKIFRGKDNLFGVVFYNSNKKKAYEGIRFDCPVCHYQNYIELPKKDTK